MVRLRVDIPQFGCVEIEADLASLMFAVVQFFVLAGGFLNKSGMI